MKNSAQFVFRNVLTVVLTVLLVQNSYFFVDDFKDCSPAHTHTISSLGHDLPVIGNIQQQQKQKDIGIHTDVCSANEYSGIIYRTVFSRLNSSGSAVVKLLLARLLSSRVFSSSL